MSNGMYAPIKKPIAALKRPEKAVSEPSDLMRLTINTKMIEEDKTAKNMIPTTEMNSTKFIISPPVHARYTTDKTRIEKQMQKVMMKQEMM